MIDYVLNQFSKCKVSKEKKSFNQEICSLKGCRAVQSWTQATVKHGGSCKFGAAFLQIKLEIWLGLLVRINADKNRQIPSGRCVISPKFILLQDIDPKYTPEIIKNYCIFRVKTNKRSWKWFQHHWVCLRLHKETEGFNEAQILRRSVVFSPRCLKQPTGRVPLKIELMLSWKERVTTPNIDLIWIDVLFIQCI